MTRNQPNPPHVQAQIPVAANAPQNAQNLNNAPFPMPAGANGPNLFRRPLTIVNDRAPTVVAVPERRPSGAAWVSEFPTSTSTDDLVSPFRENVDAFLSALAAAGANVTIAATLRPPERAFLMHWSWKISHRLVDPRDVPENPNIPIRWDHTDQAGQYSSSASKAAADAMVAAYGMQNLRDAPALNSRHIAGNAIDMSISWQRDLAIDLFGGVPFTISTLPRTGMNTSLHSVGASYGVIKYRGGDRDKPHWSTDGR